MSFKSHIPNFFTLLNLFSGCLALMYLFQENVNGMAWAMGFAMVFDFVDGLLARLLNATSELGKQLDSFADLISFGMVPGMVVYTLFTQSRMAESLDAGMYFIPLFAWLIPVFSAVRLARFNLVQLPSRDFLGLPTPANALWICSLPLIITHSPDSPFILNLVEWPALLGATGLSCFLLIAPIKLFSLKIRSLTIRENVYPFLLLLMGGLGLLFYQFRAIPFIIGFYLLLSGIKNYLDRI